MLSFHSDLGDSGKALGWYDTETNQTNINLEGIYVACLLDFYNCIPEPPTEFQRPERFDSHMIGVISRTFTHECLHEVLNRCEGEVASCALDNLEEFV